MDNFAHLHNEEKLAYIVATADAKGVSSLIVEKDFWVCWTLKRLFESRMKDHLIFKGGTSLSKVYGLIERFSEDIDISIDKEILGFGGDGSPEKAGSNKQIGKRLDALADRCSEFVCGECKPELEELIHQHLPKEFDWALEIDPDDLSGQTLLFKYPKALDDKRVGYIRQAVKIEFGARADHWPAKEHQIEPFISEQYPDAMQNPTVQVLALKAERTFWEKATILHYYAHYPDHKNVPTRQSRHFYDFYRLIDSTLKNSAEKDQDLLARVAEHKSIYFRTKWASYDTAKKGSLKLIPSERVLKEMERDYRAMSEMFYGNVPSWREMIASIEQFEKLFNGKTG